MDKNEFIEFIRKTPPFNTLEEASLLYSSGDKILFTSTLGDLIGRKEIITASKDISIKEAAEIMSRRKISSIVLIDPSDNVPVGIVTDRDLRDRVIAKGRGFTEPVSSIMSASLIKAEADDYCFEALLKMIHYNIHHLLVIDSGRLRGIVTNHDFMMLQGISPLSIAREIESQHTIEGLVSASNKINRIIDLLVREGAKAANIIRIITEINDRLLKRILDIAENRMGPPPLKYCWIVYGSEGRKEQTFKTDQDNAIIYEDPETEEEAVRAKGYFSEFASFMKESLIKCGFQACPADYMASNPKWRQPLSAWKEYFEKWINQPTQEAVLFSLIFFDFRPIGGDITLAQNLRAYLTQALKNQNLFLAKMAGVIIRNRPPLGFLGSLSVIKKGEHKNEMNIKERGVGLIVDALRLFAIEKGISSTSTLDRLKDLRGRHSVVDEFGDEIEQAFEFLMSLRLRRQLEQIQAAHEPDNYINPDNLNMLQRNALKGAFKLISRIQDIIVEQYSPGMVTQ